MTENADFEKISENGIAIVLATIVAHAIANATDEEYQDRMARRQELREELSAPEWIPQALAPYYNMATWGDRLALFVADLQHSDLSPLARLNWYRWPVLEALAHWQIQYGRTTRWEAHDDW